MGGAKGYSYSLTWRMTEVSGIVSFAVLLAFTVNQCWLALSGPFHDYALMVLVASFFLAIFAADFISGLFHFLADNFGSEDMPILGPNVIYPFREHHVDPKEIARHDWIETNGNNCLICIPWMIFFLAVIPTQEYLAAVSWMTFWSFFLVGIMLTNQFHKWSHQDDRAGWVRLLQRCWLILPEDHHDIHHTAPFDRYYCITVGWLNPVLDVIGFWTVLHRLLLPVLPRKEASKKRRKATQGAGAA